MQLTLDTCNTRTAGISSFVKVIVQLSGVSGNKPTESEGDSPRMKIVYVTINPRQLYYKCYASRACSNITDSSTWIQSYGTYVATYTAGCRRPGLFPCSVYMPCCCDC